MAHVTARARISRSTFYENFANVSDCLRAAHEDAQRRLWEAARSAAAVEADWPAQARAALAAALAFFAGEPSAAYLLGAAGKAADAGIAAAHAAATACLATLLRGGRACSLRAAELPEATEPILIGNLTTLLESFFVSGDPAQLPALAPQLTELILTPYVGTEEARRVASAGS